MKDAKGIDGQDSLKLLTDNIAFLLCILFYLQEGHLCSTILLHCRMRTVMFLYSPNQSGFGITLNWTFSLMSTFMHFVAVCEIAGLSWGSKSLSESFPVSGER